MCVLTDLSLDSCQWQQKLSFISSWKNFWGEGENQNQNRYLLLGYLWYTPRNTDLQGFSVRYLLNLSTDTASCDEVSEHHSSLFAVNTLSTKGAAGSRTFCPCAGSCALHENQLRWRLCKTHSRSHSPRFLHQKQSGSCLNTILSPWHCTLQELLSLLHMLFKSGAMLAARDESTVFVYQKKLSSVIKFV